MTNEQLAELLTQFADLLDIKGESGFRVSAYRRGADAIKHLTEPVPDLIQAGTLTDIKGIGKGLAGLLGEIVQSGSFPELEELQDEVPATLLTVLAIPGVGPKTVGRLYRELAITNIDDLESATRDGQIRALKGMGTRQETRILEGIAFLRQRTGRTSIGTALPAARDISQALEQSLGGPVSIAGSVRRYSETVGNIDILVAHDDVEIVYATLEHEFGPEQCHRDHGQIVVSMSTVCPLRVVVANRGCHGTALVRLTGSSGHVASLSQLGDLPDMADEAEVYQTLGLEWIPPELREVRGEIDAAASAGIPDLVSIEAINGDLHLHSNWSDGRATIRELADRARALDYQFLSIADHSRSLAIANGLTPERLLEQAREIQEVNQDVPEVRLIRASEVEVLRDGSLDFPDDVLAQLDLVVASLHSGRSMTRDELTQRLLGAIENPNVDIIGHPTGRIIEQRPPADYDWEAVFEAAARTRTALEINANPARLDLPEELARRAVDAGVLISINSDAHDLGGLDLMEFGVGIARRGWVPRESVINCWEADRLFEWLNRDR